VIFASDTNGFLGWADLGLKFLALLVLVIGVMQLLEARRKRHVDIYWELFERYISPPGRNARSAMREVEQELRLVDNDRLPPQKAAAAERYNELFHDRDVESGERVHPSVHPRVLDRLRYLNQAGILLHKKLVDRDLLLELVAAGVKIDRTVIDVTLEAVRDREGLEVYLYVDYLIVQVEGYIAGANRGAGKNRVTSRKRRRRGGG